MRVKGGGVLLGVRPDSTIVPKGDFPVPLSSQHRSRRQSSETWPSVMTAHDPCHVIPLRYF